MGKLCGLWCGLALTGARAHTHGLSYSLCSLAISSQCSCCNLRPDAYADCYLNLSRGVHPNVVDNNIALRKTLGITSSMGLEFAKWNVEPWDWGFPNFTARNTTREFQLRCP